LVDKTNRMAKKKVIQLPTDCLSYSQVTLWQSDRERYKEIFFNKNDSARFMNEGMAYGKIVADALETETDTGDLLTDMAISLLVKYDIRDKEMEGIMHTKDGDIRIVSHPDTMDSKTLALREYKTGKTKWTQKKADGWFQLKFYATLIYIIHKKIPPEVHLDWIETFKDSDGVIKPTGRVESFKVNITMSDIINTMALISRVAKEIEAEWVNYTPPPEIPW
jgi:hypothetical protein